MRLRFSSLGYLLLALALFAAGAAAPAQAERRLAFVAGINAYANLPAPQQLERAITDATAVADTLEGLGFTVERLMDNVTRDNFRDRFRLFVDSIKTDDVVIFYFSGHGVSIDGRNYLIPADIPVPKEGEESRFKVRAISESDLIDDLRTAGARVVIDVIDACRDNPFAAATGRSLGGSRGLERTISAEGVLSIYSAAPGQEALDRFPGDDPDPNSVFTRVFIKELTKPINLVDLGESVKDDVAALASARQMSQKPAVENRIIGARNIFLAGKPVAMQAEHQDTPPIADACTVAGDPDIALHKAQEVDSAETYETLLRCFPNHPRRDYVLALYERKAEEGLWVGVEKAGNDSEKLTLIDRLLAQFPKGYYLDRATQLRDQILNASKPGPAQDVDTTPRDFDVAERADTPEGWNAFLQLHPAGPFSSVAKYRLALRAAPPQSAKRDLQAGDQATESGSYYYVTGLDPNGDNWLALRSGPSFQAPWSATHMGPGTLLTVLEWDGEWVHAKLPSGEIGWANSKYVACCRKGSEGPGLGSGSGPGPVPQGGSFYYVTGLDPNGLNWLALRNAPSSKAPWSATQMGPGTLLTKLGEQGEWYHVRLQSGEAGWANSRFIACCRGAGQTLAGPPQQVAGTYYYVTGLDPNGLNWLALRNAPSSKAPWSATQMGPGTLLTKLGEVGEWFRVRLQSGETGWANSRFLACCRKGP